MTKSPGKATNTAENPSPVKSKRAGASDKAGGSKSKKQKCTAIVKVKSKVVLLTQRLRTRGLNPLANPTTISAPLIVEDDSGDSVSGNRDSLTHQGSDLAARTGAGVSGTAKGRHAFHLEEMVDDPEDVRLAFDPSKDVISLLTDGHIRKWEDLSTSRMKAGRNNQQTKEKSLRVTRHARWHLELGTSLPGSVRGMSGSGNKEV
ncbi:unnamed protein product [Arabis nemorensis]|uniref:Uncharacterized protein n=1 Tax=Arabis nemorensis TaxID=586526 RepID=A0A565ATM5_9BRAS|nr:unnamed protein product [Arabis nemorensis]